MYWFARHRSRIVRGLVVSQQDGKGWRAVLQHRLALWVARPDFVACDIRDLPSPFSDHAHSQGLPVLTWTVRTQEDRARAALHADQIIFEATGE